MLSESSLRALLVLCSERDSMLEDIVAHYGLVGSPALGETDGEGGMRPNKDVPIRLLHGGGHSARGVRAGGNDPDVPANGAAREGAAQLPARGLPLHEAARPGVAREG